MRQENEKNEPVRTGILYVAWGPNATDILLSMDETEHIGFIFQRYRNVIGGKFD